MVGQTISFFIAALATNSFFSVCFLKKKTVHTEKKPFIPFRLQWKAALGIFTHHLKEAALANFEKLRLMLVSTILPQRFFLGRNQKGCNQKEKLNSRNVTSEQSNKGPYNPSSDSNLFGRNHKNRNVHHSIHENEAGIPILCKWKMLGLIGAKCPEVFPNQCRAIKQQWLLERSRWHWKCAAYT